MQDNSTQALIRSFISLRLQEFNEGFLSSVKKVGNSLRQEIDRYLQDYDPLNELEFE